MAYREAEHAIRCVVLSKVRGRVRVRVGVRVGVRVRVRVRVRLGVRVSPPHRPRQGSGVCVAVWGCPWLR